jgi:hypothetical protein
MRLLWKLVKVAVALVLLVPVTIIVLATALGIFGALLGLAVLALKLAVVGLVGYGLFKVLVYFLRGERRSFPAELKPLPPRDPHYEAAMRELDRELGNA